MQKERFSDHNNWFSNICRENLISFLFVWKKQGESFTVLVLKKKIVSSKRSCHRGNDDYLQILVV